MFFPSVLRLLKKFIAQFLYLKDFPETKYITELFTVYFYFISIILNVIVWNIHVIFSAVRVTNIDQILILRCVPSLMFSISQKRSPNNMRIQYSQVRILLDFNDVLNSLQITKSCSNVLLMIWK